MKRILTILLMTVAFAMNVSVVNAQNTWGPNDNWTFSYQNWGIWTFVGDNVDFNNYYLYWTTDNSDPNEQQTSNNSNIMGYGPQISNTNNTVTKIKILVVGKNGYNNNYNHIFEFSIDNSTNTCTLVKEDPTKVSALYFSRDAENPNIINISTSTSGATIHYGYTTDGTTPDNSNIAYTGTEGTSKASIIIQESETLKIIAYATKDNFTQSDTTTSDAFPYKSFTATPTFSRTISAAVP